MALFVKEYKYGRGEAAGAVEEKDKVVERVGARRLLMQEEEVVDLTRGENIS